MVIDKGQAVEKVLSDLKSSSIDIQGAAVVSLDGLMMGAYLPLKDIDPDSVGAMSAALLGLAKRASETLHLGNFSEIYIKSQEGTLHLYTISDKGVLAVLAKKEANIGMVNLESRNVAKQIAGILEG